MSFLLWSVEKTILLKIIRNIMKKIVLFGAVLGALPMFAFADWFSGPDAWEIFGKLQGLLNIIIPILITLAVIYFIWGVIKYTLSTDEEAKKKARGMIIAGLIGLFIIVAFWGVISIITSTFGVGPMQLDVNALPCIENPAAGIECIGQ